MLADMDDDIAHERHISMLKREIVKTKPNADVTRDLMQYTYGRRRQWLLGDVKPVEEICTEYPLLKKAHFVSPTYTQ